jgi:hypothetical protein
MSLKSRLRAGLLWGLWRLDGRRYHPVRAVNRTCPICGYHGPFDAFGTYFVRPDAVCRGCGSRERHRLLKLLLDADPSLAAGARALHAPRNAPCAIC